LVSLEADQQYISEFGEVLLFIIGGTVFLLLTFFAARMIRPDRPSPEKLTTYESGEEALGSAWTQFNVRFYVIALIFLLFEVEIIFLFPWSTVFANKQLIEQTNGLWGWFAVIEAVIFIVVLALGLVYAWVHGHLDWIKPEPDPTQYRSPVPRTLYEKINIRYQKTAGEKLPKQKGETI
jgi:NADH-quinone oxidoreductase subunit A